MDMTAVILPVVKMSITLSVFAVGLKATFADATFLFRQPGHLFRAFLSMNVLMPLFALAIAVPLDLHPAVKVALVVISVSPIPPVFPSKALKAGGTEAYTVGLLVAASLLSIIVIPLSIEMLELITGVSLVMQASSVAALVLTTILAPLLAGIVVRSIARTAADRMARPISIVAPALLLTGALPILIGLAGKVFSLIGDGTVLSLAGFALAGLIIGHVLGGPEPENRRVLALATSARHPAVALAIAHANAPEEQLAGPAVVLYLILAGLLSALYLSWIEHKRAGSAPAVARSQLKA